MLTGQGKPRKKKEGTRYFGVFSYASLFSCKIDAVKITGLAALSCLMICCCYTLKATLPRKWPCKLRAMQA